MQRPKLGQHFLRDPRVIKTILQAAELKPGDRILEIGPGRGVLTNQVIPLVKHLTAIELDRELAHRLQTQWDPRDGRVRILELDILKADLDALFPGAGPDHPIKILGNLPYAIAAAIFEKILAWPGWQTGVFLVQREVGERMLSGPGSRTFGVLSLAVQLYAEGETILKVKPGAFTPPPRVTSLVIRLHRKKSPALEGRDVAAFFDLVHAAFSHRRKTLANSLALYTRRSKAEVESWLATHLGDARQRAETLALSDYVHLAPLWYVFRREKN